MPLSPEEIKHYQGKCDSETCELCAEERASGITPREMKAIDGMRQIGFVDYVGVGVPVWSFGGPRMYAGMDLSPDTLYKCEYPVFSARTIEELQATIDVAIILNRPTKGQVAP